MTRGKAISYLSAIFVAGLLAGGLASFGLGKRSQRSPPRPEQIAEHIRSRLRGELKLDDEQLRKLDALLPEFANDLHVLFLETHERFEARCRQLDQRLEEFLTPQQREKLLQLQKQREEKFRKFCEPKAGR